MKSVFVVVLCALIAGGCGTSAPGETQEGGQMSRSIIDPYLRIQEALANDSIEGVRQNAGELTTASTRLGAPGMRIQTAATSLTSATELEDARTKFGNLSAAIDTYMTGLKLTLPEGVKVAYCPMVSKPWLQEGDSLRNPYYGSSMLTCGEFR
jgi:hypothetical protein